MATKAELIEALANTIADYRKGEIAQPNAEHVELWLAQFPKEDRTPVLSEMAHVLENTYISRKTAKSFIKSLISNEDSAGKESKPFWKKVNFLNIQENGNSQADFLKLFNESLNSQLGLQTDQCGGGDVHVYLDDVVFTGGRAGNDLEAWIQDDAPESATIHVIVMAHHTFGAWKMEERLKKCAAACSKKITVRVWSAVSLENRLARKNTSDVLWPTSLPDEAAEYGAGKFPFIPRAPGGASKIFSGEKGRNALEQSLVRAGMKIRGFSANPKSILRPMGFSPFGVGFGSTIVTYRNCPNNAPLALWWGDPNADAGHPFSKWRPLVPRKTYGGADFDD
jgi:hypothetical protein